MTYFLSFIIFFVLSFFYIMFDSSICGILSLAPAIGIIFLGCKKGEKKKKAIYEYEKCAREFRRKYEAKN